MRSIQHLKKLQTVAPEYGLSRVTFNSWGKSLSKQKSFGILKIRDDLKGWPHLPSLAIRVPQSKVPTLLKADGILPGLDVKKALVLVGP